jgi:hypothetical protein
MYSSRYEVTYVEVAMRTHMLREVPMREVPIVKRVKIKPAGSATAGVSVSFFLSSSLPEPDKCKTRSKCNTSRH